MSQKILLIAFTLMLCTGLAFAQSDEDEQYFHLDEALEKSPLTAFVLAFNGLIILTSLYFIIKITVEVWRRHIIHG